MAVEAEDDAAALDLADEVHRTPPHRLEVPERVARIVDLEIDAIVLVDEEQLAAVLVVPLLHRDDGLAEVGQHVEELLLHLLEVALQDLPALVLLVVAEGEELLIQAEVEGEELVDEGDVVVVLADLEDLLAPPPGVLVPAAALLEGVAVVELLAEQALVSAVL